MVKPPVVRDVGGIPVAFFRKRVRYLRMAVCPPGGEVRVSVPWHVPEAEAIAFVYDRLDWVRARIEAMRRMPRPAPCRYKTGDAVEVFGATVRLRVVEAEGRADPHLEGGELVLPVRPGATEAERRVVFAVWMRARLAEKLSALVARWTAAMGEAPVHWDIRRMKSRWGSCTARSRSLRFNLHLARVPERCIEYVVVHELAHLEVQNHSRAFWAVVARHLPDWRTLRRELNRTSLPGE